MRLDKAERQFYGQNHAPGYAKILPLNITVMRCNLPFIIHISFAICALLVVSCSKSTQADSRQDQEKMFRELFGFEPPKAVSEIKYKDVYNRRLMNGGWGRWMVFTYTEEVFSKILKEQGYKQREELHFVDLKSDAAPIWWPTVDQSKITLYLRGHEDTKESEGYSFQDYIWHDTNSNFVYFHKRYWD
jgi:hypothetical protein